jgi:cobalt-zinc-cadmium efflux system membrane fusion protein
MTAVVRSVTPALDPQTRAATVVLTLTGGTGAVAPGEAVQAQISPRSAAPAGIVITDEAVQTVGGREVVFVRTPTGFRVQPVVVVARSGGRASIATGLASGQAIATRNAFLLKAELTKGAEDGE